MCIIYAYALFETKACFQLILTLNSFGSHRMIMVNGWPAWKGNDGWSFSSGPQEP